MNKLLLIFTIIVLSFAALQISEADVFFITEEGGGMAQDNPFTQASVAPTDGDEGDFEILACATANTGANMFTGAEPGWDLVNQGGCGGSADCILGIFEKFSPEPNNAQSTCAWTEGTNVFGGFVFRYGGADPIIPIGDFACNSGEGITVTTPSVTTTEGSMVLRIVASDTRNPALFVNLPGSVEIGKVLLNGIAGIPAQAITLFSYNEIFEEAGTAPEVAIALNNIPQDEWRACTISIRMEGSPRISPIPTLSEWGMFAFVAIAGVAAVFFIRRRSVRA